MSERIWDFFIFHSKIPYIGKPLYIRKKHSLKHKITHFSIKKTERLNTTYDLRRYLLLLCTHCPQWVVPVQNLQSYRWVHERPGCLLLSGLDGCNFSPQWRPCHRPPAGGSTSSDETCVSWVFFFVSGLKDLQIILVCMICLGRWAERFLNRGVNHFLLAVASSPHLHSSPTYPTQLNSCACLTSWYLKLQLCPYSERVVDYCTDRSV